MPDPASLHTKLTCTSVRLQPAAFGTEVTIAVIVGGVVSVTAATPAIRTDRWVPGLLRSSIRRVLFPVARSATVRAMTAFQS